MQIDFYFLARLFLLFYLWIFIAICVFFIFQSRKIYFRLNEFEKLCVSRRREIIHNFLPVVFDLAKRNKSFKAVLNLNRRNVKDFVLSVFPLFFQSFLFYKWVKTGFNLTRKVLR